MKFKSLTDMDILGEEKDFKINISSNKEKKIITIKDNGIGMTYEEVLENIGTIAKSGSKAFSKEMKETEKTEEIDIIGQFGVGFYSAFMIAERIVLETKSPYSESGVRWTSTGDGSYEIEEIEKKDRGTEIILEIRDTEEDLEFTDENKLRGLIKKYSDYVRYPILIADEVVNSTKPIWKEKKSELSEEKYNEFYKANFHDYENSSHYIHINVQGNLEYTALLFAGGIEHLGGLVV
ncbi:hypothetical protein GJ496_007494 [Pomphorhynchus laevis]|nr:hypothetical protein GJ496_007494 [Pomphorhynchus laevis]